MKQRILFVGFAFWFLSCNNRSDSAETADTATITTNTATTNPAASPMPATSNGMGRATTGFYQRPKTCFGKSIGVLKGILFFKSK